MENKKQKEFYGHIPEIEKKLGYTFKDKSLITQAFTRTSFSNEHKSEKGERYQSNEVLEFFGDSVLSAAIVTMIIKQYSERYEHGIKTELAEGDFSNIKSKLSDKKNLSDRMRELGLSKYLRMGEGDTKLGVENEPSVMEDLFESIIGAIYIDSGMDMPRVVKTVSKMLSIKEYMTAKAAPAQSSKNSLQEWCADKKRRLPPPAYKTVSESGPQHKKVYERACYIGERMYAVGVGKNQKLADADAAEKTLKILVSEEKNGKFKSSQADESAVEKLMEYVRSSKLTGINFYDLGESEYSTPELPSFRVACKVGELSSEGVGMSKKSARADSAAKLLSLIKKKNEASKKQKKNIHSAPKSKPRVVAKNKT